MIQNHLIIIPGLGNNVKAHDLATSGFRKFNIIPHVFDARWKIEENGFQPKLNRAMKLVDALSIKNSRISLVGNSAGSSFALNMTLFKKRIIDFILK